MLVRTGSLLMPTPRRGTGPGGSGKRTSVRWRWFWLGAKAWWRTVHASPAQRHRDCRSVYRCRGPGAARQQDFGHAQPRPSQGDVRSAYLGDIDSEAVAVCHQDIPPAAGPVGLAAILAEQARSIVGRRAVRLVRALPAVEAPFTAADAPTASSSASTAPMTYGSWGLQPLERLPGFHRRHRCTARRRPDGRHTRRAAYRSLLGISVTIKPATCTMRRQLEARAQACHWI